MSENVVTIARPLVCALSALAGMFSARQRTAAAPLAEPCDISNYPDGYMYLVARRRSVPCPGCAPLPEHRRRVP